MNQSNWKRIIAGLMVLSVVACEQAPIPSADVSSQMIDNVLLIDGTGAKATRGALRMDKGLIVELGDLEPLPGELVLDGGGLALAPGFIDTHSHADYELDAQPQALAAVSQGITTAVIGQDGFSRFPLLDFRFKLIDQPVAINLATYTGHNSLRQRVMGKDFRRPASVSEIRVMTQFLREDMEAGSLGLGTGLEYDPGIYSETEEVIELAKIAAGYGGRYISHMRSEDRWFPEALEEIIRIGREADIPVQISHFKLAMTSLWGRAPEFLARLDRAREAGVEISADVYPYEYWQSNMMVLLPERDTADLAEIEYALKEIAPPDGMWFSQYDPDPSLVGKTLAEVAAGRGDSAEATFMSLINASEALSAESGEAGDLIIATSMREEDIKALLSWPHSNVCTDGSLQDQHPRGIGSYPRVLGRYVREQGLMSLEEAVHKMTGLAAHHMGFANRGVLRAGAAADLVLFDPKTITDHATPQNPSAMSSGVRKVWVNGTHVFENGKASGFLPGRYLARED